MRNSPRCWSKAVALLVSTALLTPALLGAGLAPGRQEAPPAASADDLARKTLDAHNKERADAKLPPLRLAPKLSAAAKGHAEDMAKHGMMTHDGSDGSTPVERVKRQGYLYRNSGENVAAGAITVEGVMHLWMNSPHHKDNILGAFAEMGVASAEGADGKPYWCVVFGTPWPALDPEAATADVLTAINRERAAAKRPPLKSVKSLQTVAAGQAKTTAEDADLKEKLDRGDNLGRALRESGYRFKSIAELIAYGQPDAAGVVPFLLKDKANRDQVLGDFTDVGLGVVTSASGAPYWCVILAKPLAR